MECSRNGVVTTYIGESGRKLSERLNEHFRKIKNDDYNNKLLNLTQVQKHMYRDHKAESIGDWTVDVLSISNNIQDRKVMEALEIKHHKPTLNADNGLSIII